MKDSGACLYVVSVLLMSRFPADGSGCFWQKQRVYKEFGLRKQGFREKEKYPYGRYNIKVNIML